MYNPTEVEVSEGMHTINVCRACGRMAAQDLKSKRFRLGSETGCGVGVSYLPRKTSFVFQDTQSMYLCFRAHTVKYTSSTITLLKMPFD